MSAVGVVLTLGAIALLVLTVAAVVRFRRSGGSREDLRRAEDMLKWYEQTPGG